MSYKQQLENGAYNVALAIDELIEAQRKGVAEIMRDQKVGELAEEIIKLLELKR